MSTRLDVSVILKLATSLDGYLDDNSSSRRVFSSCEDAQAVQKLRAECDAILIGAETLRRDRPRLLLTDEELCHWREAQGKQGFPAKVVLTQSGNLPDDSPFFQTGAGEKIVICSEQAMAKLPGRISDLASIIVSPTRNILTRWVLQTLRARGINNLLVEGGAKIAELFLREGTVDVMRLAVANICLGNNGGARFAPRVIDELPFALRRVERLGEMVVLHYAKSECQSA